MGKVIGVCGLIGSGKGTVADILVNKYGFEKLSFADRLKDGAAAIFGWPRDLLEGDTKDSRDWRQVPDTFWTNELCREITPRLVLQLMGTECMRKGFDESIWVSLVKQRIQADPDKNWVIPDVRFENEQEMIGILGGEVWQVRRGELPDWWNKAVASRDNPERAPMCFRSDIHPSEWHWVDDDKHFDVIIENNGTLEALDAMVASGLFKR